MMTIFDYINLFGGNFYEGRNNVAYIHVNGWQSEFIKNSAGTLLTISYNGSDIDLRNPTIEKAKKAFELLDIKI
jgi:hypothetical protein